MYKSDFLLDCHAIKLLHILQKNCGAISKEKLQKEMDISEEIFIRTTKVLLDAKFITYTEGRDVTYTLTKNAKEISILDIFQTVNAMTGGKTMLNNRERINRCLENKAPDNSPFYKHLTFKIEKELSQITLADLNLN